ncbi:MULTISPECIES: AAA family ATPase [unclassified Pseudomonas]|uniref:AAA family ATPase n=1 Tax=unclassified Pseudomonas TaxID=196821 RepID=UPI00128B95CB|nr:MULTISPECIES: AAA family ATPase [unclassified Pseudomonas]MPQ71134.1 AAA family ATPase [Pseudomonas sp. MWU12-2323]
MKIKNVKIQAFRAYNSIENGTFDFLLKDGEPAKFVALYAPNGFGKSSFYDAVEWALTKSIGRYVRASTKTNNVAAADNSKDPESPQYILRNHDAPLKLKTSVSVLTTISKKPFTRNLSPAVEGARDFSFTGKVAKGRAAFRDIFLSQEGVDAFIRESKPAERYERFMDTFSVDAEDTRKKLYALRSENAQVLDEISDEISKLEELIAQPVDLTAFEQYNLAVDSLDEEGQNLKVSESNLNQASEGNLKFMIAEIIRRFESLTELKNSKIELLKSLILDSAVAYDSENSLADTSETFGHLSTAVTKSRRYKELNIQIGSQQAVLAELNSQLSELKQVAQSLPQFDITTKSIATLEQSLSEASLSLKNEESTHKTISIALEKLSKNITDTDTLLHQWRSYQDAARNSFLIIQTESALVQDVNLKIQDLESRLSALNISELALSERINKLSISGLDRHNVISNMTGLIPISEDVSIRLASANRRVIQLDAQLSENALALKAVNDQSGLFGQLVNLGQSLILEHKGANCPLCNHPYDDHEKLLAAIAKNDAIPSLQNYLQQQAQSISAERETTVNEADELLRRILQFVDEALASVRLTLAEVTKNKLITESEITTLRSQQTTATGKLNAAKEHTLQMDEPALANHINSQISIIEANKKSHVSLRIIEEQGFRQCLSLIEQSQKKIQELSLSIDVYKGQPAYLFIAQYANKIGLPLGAGLHDHCTIQQEKLIQQLSNSETLLNQALTETSTLQSWMVQAETWLKDSDIEQAYTELYASRVTWLDLQSNFRKRFSEALNIPAPSTLNLTHGLLNGKISEYLTECTTLRKKIDTCSTLQELLPVLLPYIEHLTHKRNLSPLMLLKTQHEALQERLKNEISEVVSYLESKISGFFYNDLINEIYKKIDPHPNFNTVEFVPTFSQDERPSLHIVVVDEKNKRVPPTLYFSAAQLNILSLSIFLAKAIHATYEGTPIDVIFIDDPMHSMDSINILSTIDLLRNISRQLNKQIIISTHDENFYKLLQKKIPLDNGSKFLRLESYGVVRAEPAQL